MPSEMERRLYELQQELCVAMDDVITERVSKTLMESQNATDKTVRALNMTMFKIIERNFERLDFSDCSKFEQALIENTVLDTRKLRKNGPDDLSVRQ